jgi:nucleoside-diphosphate-sugar epimerase
MDVLIVGCGYVGRRAARLWLRGGHRVSALTRSAVRGNEFAAEGIAPVIGDVSDSASLAVLPACDVLLYAVGYDRTGSADKRSVYVNGLRNVLDAVGTGARRVVYLSSVSVYGQSDGSWIDEDSPTQPQSEAESLLRESCRVHGVECCILRLAGIYGPQRVLARVESLQRGEPLAGRGDAWLNLIHGDDAATTCLAAAAHPAPQSLYLVSDDRPVTRAEYYAQLAELIGAPAPTFDPAQAARHGEGLNKRCRNTKVHDSLGIVLQYPTCEEGLRQSLA